MVIRNGFNNKDQFTAYIEVIDLSYVYACWKGSLSIHQLDSIHLSRRSQLDTYSSLLRSLSHHQLSILGQLIRSQHTGLYLSSQLSFYAHPFQLHPW